MPTSRDDVKSKRRLHWRRAKHAPFKRSYAALVSTANRHRRNPTLAEAILWNAIRQQDRRKPLGVSARREAVICGYIADFYIPKWRLIIEIDGGYHDDPIQADRDVQRARWLCGNGYQIIRFTNQSVETNLADVLTEIAAIGSRMPDFAGFRGRHPKPPELDP